MSKNQLPHGSGHMPVPSHGMVSDSTLRLRPPSGAGGGHASSTNDDDVIDLRDLWRIFVAHKKLLLIAMLLGLLAALLLSFIRTPTYQASTTLQMATRPSQVVKFRPEMSDTTMTDFEDRTRMGTYLELLNSRTLAERVIKELNLDRVGLHGASSGAASNASAETTANADVGEGASSGDGAEGTWNYWRQRVQKNWKKIRTPAVFDTEQLNHEELLKAFQETVSVKQVPNSSMIKVSVDNPDSDLAARIANAMASEFIALNRDRRFDASSYAQKFLDEQLGITKNRLEESEARLNDYAREHRIMRLDGKTSTLNQTFIDYSSALVRAEQERIKLEAQYESIKNAPSTASQVLASTTIQTYKTQRAALDAEYQQKSKIYKDNYPVMLQLRAQMQDLNSKIQAEINNIRQSIVNQLTAAKQEENKIRTQVNDARAEIVAARDDEVNYNLLAREVDTNRELYDGLLQQLKEVSVAAGVEPNDIQVVDRAETPLFPYKPRFVLNSAIGLMAGLMLGLIAIFLRESFDDSVKSAEELEKNFGLPVLGVIPNVKGKGKDTKALAFVTHKYPRGRLAEAYRSLRTALQFTSSAGAPNRIVVSSTTNTEGKSTTALALALNFAQLGVKVALIDADMRNPMVHKYFDIENTSGLSSYLSGKDAKGTLFNSMAGNVDNLTVITSGPVPANPVELLNSARFSELLDALTESGYEQIIIDGPPVLGLADAVVLGRKVMMLYVAQAKAARVEHIRAALRRLRMSGVVPMGFVLTRATAAPSSYYAHDAYYGYGTFPMPIEPRHSPSALPG